jgi:hypothetical protein
MFRYEKIEKISTHIETVKSLLKSHVQDSLMIAAVAGQGGGPVPRIILSENYPRYARLCGGPVMTEGNQGQNGTPETESMYLLHV